MINVATGTKQSYILEGEGEAVKILQEAKAICESIETVRQSVDKDNRALRLKLVERYLENLSNILDESKVVMLPESTGSDLSKLIATGVTMYNKLGGPKTVADAVDHNLI